MTLSRIGGHCVVDPTPEEEACCTASLVLGVAPDGAITSARKLGPGGFHAHTLTEAMELGVEIGKELNQRLEEKLKEEEAMGFERETIGFLR